MKWFELLKFSLGNLLRRKLRTALTVLGVMIGTASIVVMMSLGIGLNSSYMEQVQSSTTLTMITIYNDNYYMYDSKDSGGSSDIKLTKESVQSFYDIEHVTCASPVYSFNVLFKSGKYESNSNVNAVSLDLLKAFQLPIISGSLPEEGDELKLLMGKETAYNFYDPSSNNWYGGWDENGNRTDPLVSLTDDTIYAIYDTNAYYNALSGEGVMPKKYMLEDITVLGKESTDNYSYSMYDYNIYCDIDAVDKLFTKMFKKSAWPNQQTDKNGKPVTPMTYNQAYVLVDDIENVTTVQQQLKDMGYQASSEIEYLESMKKQSRTIQYVLAGIGSVSLIVAAIGITNTMLMSIFERTKEIGIFKVLGCSLKNIRTMFLMEAGLIGFGGGLCGVTLSYLLSFAINILISSGGEKISVIPIWLALLGMGFAVVVGMVAGISPASRAMKLSPLEAIRTL